MKSIGLTAASALLLAAFAPAAAAAADRGPAIQYRLVTSCVVTLSTSDGPLELPAARSDPYSPTVDGFGDSRVMLQFGEHTLTAAVMMKGTVDGFEPKLTLDLFAGNPVAGSIVSMDAGGLGLEARPLHSTYTLTGRNWVEGSYDGKLVSRVDYTCSLTKVI